MNPDDDGACGTIPGRAATWRRLPMPGGDAALLEAMALPAPADALLAELLVDVPWRQDLVKLFGREIPQPRLTSWYGDAGAHYRYSGLSLEPMPWTPRLADLRARVEHAAGATFDSCLLNLYRDGRDAIGWHADDERALGPAPVIASLSLGAVRVMSFRPKDGSRERVKAALPAGSLLVMRGGTQARWQHAIARTAAPCGPRVSLTFRRVGS